MEIRCASNPKDAKHYTTDRLREEFHISKLFTKDNIRMVYSHIDRIITAGLMPVYHELKLEGGKELASDYFLERREMGCINIGGKGIVTVDGVDYEMNPRDGIYIGMGNKEADVMFIGEAPGESEDLQGLPFVGASGQLLDKYLEAVGIDREEVYICNILKCRPPQNRDPLPEEQEACMDHLRAQVRLVKPKMIVCLGRIAAMRLISPDYRITREHGVFQKRGNFLITAVYHPSALLRDPSKKEDMLKDMLRIAEEYKKIKEE